MFLLRRLFGALPLILLLTGPGIAMEGGQTPSLRGYRDFGMGLLPRSGVVVRQDFYHYHGIERTTIPQGDLRVDLKAVASISAITAVTPWRVFGGDHAVALRFAGTNASADQSVSRPGVASLRNDRRTGFNDLVLTPAILGWHSGNFHWTAAASVWVPIGGYDRARLVNTSRNYWAVSPQFAVTWLDPQSGLEISGGGGFFYNFKNTATDYQSGSLAQAEFAAGKLLTPWFKAGIAGYYIQQLNGDSGSGATLGDRRLRVAAIGPIVSFNFVINKVPVSLIAKYYREFFARNTMQGDAGMMSVRIRF
jgi:hypothetical protein